MLHRNFRKQENWYWMGIRKEEVEEEIKVGKRHRDTGWMKKSKKRLLKRDGKKTGTLVWERNQKTRR